MARKSLTAALLIIGATITPVLTTSAQAFSDSRDNGLLKESIYAFHRANAGYPEAQAQTPSGGRLSEAQNHVYDGNNGRFPVQTRNRSLFGVR
ncbi:MAG: hypothetical protein ACRCUE_06285 [Bosea sp. (in: a-proteobacteria)]